MKKNSLISLLAGTTVLVASFAIYADDSHFTINVCNKEDIALKVALKSYTCMYHGGTEGSSLIGFNIDSLAPKACKSVAVTYRNADIPGRLNCNYTDSAVAYELTRADGKSTNKVDVTLGFTHGSIFMSGTTVNGNTSGSGNTLTPADSHSPTLNLTGEGGWFK